MALQQKARDERVSVSFLINRLIRRYIDWDIPTKEFGVIPVPSVLFSRLFEELDESKCEKLGRWMAHEFFEPIGKYYFGQMTYEASLMILKRVAQYSGRSVFDESDDKTLPHKFAIRHEGSPKVLAYYNGVIRGVYEDILKMKVNIQTKEDVTVVELGTD
jgi:hypothetical protein